jgi:hypothetical protein
MPSSLGAKRTDPACYIQNFLPYQVIRFQEEIPPTLFERAPKQHDAVKLQPTFGFLGTISHPLLPGCGDVCAKRRFVSLLDTSSNILRDLQPNLNGPQNPVRMPLL